MKQKAKEIHTASPMSFIKPGEVQISTEYANNTAYCQELRIRLSLNDWNKFEEQPFFWDLVEYLRDEGIRGNIHGFIPCKGKEKKPLTEDLEQKIEYLMKKQKDAETAQCSRNTRFAREQFMRVQDEWYWKRTNNLINSNNKQTDERIRKSEKRSFIKAAALTAVSTAAILATFLLNNKCREQ